MAIDLTQYSGMLLNLLQQGIDQLTPIIPAQILTQVQAVFTAWNAIDAMTRAYMVWQFMCSTTPSGVKPMAFPDYAVTQGLDRAAAVTFQAAQGGGQ